MGAGFATLGVPHPDASSPPDPAEYPTMLPAAGRFPTVMAWNVSAFTKGIASISYDAGSMNPIAPRGCSAAYSLASAPRESPGCAIVGEVTLGSAATPTTRVESASRMQIPTAIARSVPTMVIPTW